MLTGASRSTGIGTAICRSLARLGADIFFTHWHTFDEKEGNGSNFAKHRICEQI
jgi:3-oxoacyl-[acyl-carrier protein] reductase